MSAASAADPIAPAATDAFLASLEGGLPPPDALERLRATLDSPWTTPRQRQQILDFLIRNASQPQGAPFRAGGAYRHMAFAYAAQMTEAQRTQLLARLGSGPLSMDSANRALADALVRARPADLATRPFSDPVRRFFELLEIRAQAADRDSNVAGWVDLAAVDRQILALQEHAAVRRVLLEAQATAARSLMFEVVRQGDFIASPEFVRALSLATPQRAQEMLAEQLGPLARLDPAAAQRALARMAQVAVQIQFAELPEAERLRRAREALDALVLRLDAPGSALPPDLREAIDHLKNNADMLAKVAEVIARRAAGHASVLNDVTVGMTPAARNRFLRTLQTLEARGLTPAAASVASVVALSARLVNGEFRTARQVIELVGATADVAGATGTLLERLAGLTMTTRVLQGIGVIGSAISAGVDAYSSYELFRQGRNWEGACEAGAATAAGVGTIAGGCALFVATSWAPPVAAIAAVAYVGFKAIRGWAASADQHAMLRRHGVRLTRQGPLPPAPPLPPELRPEIPTLGPPPTRTTAPAPCYEPFAPPQLRAR